MGQIRHGSAKTTRAVRAAIQRSKATMAELAEQYDLNPKTVMKWRNRSSVEDMPMGPKDVRSAVLSVETGSPMRYVVLAEPVPAEPPLNTMPMTTAAAPAR